MAIKYIANAIPYDKLHTSMLQVTTRFIATTYTLSIYSHAIEIIAIFNSLKKNFFQKKSFQLKKANTRIEPQKTVASAFESPSKRRATRLQKDTVCVDIVR